MKNLKKFILLVLVSNLMLFSCQKDNTAENENDQETENKAAKTVINTLNSKIKIMTNNPTTADLKRKQTLDFGFNFNYPITLKYNNDSEVTLTDDSQLLTLIQEVTTAQFIKDIDFPFTITSGNSTETIASEFDFMQKIESQDVDNDDVPNYLDTDDDNDNILDINEDVDNDGDESNDDTDQDGIPNFQDTDDDNDGIDTADEDIDGDGDASNDDTDGDGIPNYQDDDDDNDGVLTSDEDNDHDGDPSNDDSDGDGTPDYQDTDSDNDGIDDGDDDDADGDGVDDDNEGDDDGDDDDDDDNG